MKRKWLIIVAFILAAVLLGLLIKSKFFSKGGLGALQISSVPKATVFLDGNQVGITPFFDDKINVGEHTVKIVPEVGETNLVTWEGKVELVPNILTVIKREFASDENASSGEVVSLEKINKKNVSSLAVVSIPDQAVVRVNNEPKGFAPVQLDDLTPGDYQVTISSPGYKDRSVSAHTVAGYKLTISAKLAQEVEGIAQGETRGETEENKEATGTATPTPTTPASKTTITPTPKTTLGPTTTPPDKPYIKVKETPTGWLRVRVEPSANATEAAKIEPGEMFPYLDEEKNGWFLIEYEKDKEGWVSGTYAELVK